MKLTKFKSEPATEVVSHDVTPLTVETEPGNYARLGWVIVLVGVIGFLVWASFAPLDKGVPMQGVVVKESNRKTIQYPQIGTVQDILVHDGDVVKAGQVLLRMNDVVVKSAEQVSLGQYFVARAAQARLHAELKGQSALTFPEELKQYKDEPRVQDTIALQNQLLQARQMALQSELAGARENIAGLSAQADGLEESREAKKQQQAILKEQLENNRELAKDGYIPRARLLDLERTYAQVNGAISEDIGNIARARRQMAELKLRMTQRGQEYQKEVRSQLSDVQKEAEALQSRIVAQSFETGNVEVKSPVDGVVVGSTVFTKGGVVGAGARLMDIVPTDDALAVEGQLPVNLVDRVREGEPVDLVFSAFNTNRTPHIPGTLTTIAADRTVDEKTGAAYYKVRAKVSAEGLKLIQTKKLDIVPGMPVELFVKTGERTMMSYLLKPVFDRSKSALSED
ncbi:HlyD family type I secretion periplasmic adaptor subunit [Duganella sp. BuS-21]|uniref:HlyD family type I secretion periplasmic adaptor subunit n=1 Tax=Duganella sp. BuS-21 TaxID=2943848 RepID=UPI0035A5D0E2